MEANDMKAMREAVCAVYNSLHDHQIIYPKERWRLMEIIDSAFARPPRQCDVGTAEEQEKRFRECCGCRCMTKCKVYEKGIALGIVNKNNYYKVGCRFVWAQMPYEEGGAK